MSSSKLVDAYRDVDVEDVPANRPDPSAIAVDHAEPVVVENDRTGELLRAVPDSDGVLRDGQGQKLDDRRWEVDYMIQPNRRSNR